MFVQSAHESYNTYIVTKKEIEIIQKKRSEKENKNVAGGKILARKNSRIRPS